MSIRPSGVARRTQIASISCATGAKLRRWSGVGPSRAQRILMLARAVALVARPAIARMGGVIIVHQPVPLMLGDDRGGGDRQAQGVASDDRQRCVRPFRAAIAVDQDHRRRGAGRDQRVDGTMHGEHRGPQDVEPVYLLDGCDADADRRHLPDRAAQILAPDRAELLRIVDALGHLAPIEHHRRRDHRPGQRPPPRLVNAGDGQRMRAFELEGRAGHEAAFSGSACRITSSRFGSSSTERSRDAPVEKHSRLVTSLDPALEANGSYST